MLFVSNINNEVVLLYVCVVCFFFATRLSGFIVCILWSCFLFVVLFSMLVSFLFFIPLKKGQKTDTPKRKNKMQKRGIFQPTQLCSQIVNRIFGGGLKNAIIC